MPYACLLYTSHSDEERTDNLVGVLDGYFSQGAHHLNVNVFGTEKLIDAMEHPETVSYTHLDGCAPLQTFFRIVLPILKPTVITIAILNAMWIWNDYLDVYKRQHESEADGKDRRSSSSPG